jgi:hypothetical protein
VSAPETAERHVALWEAVRSLHDRGPLPTVELLDVWCSCWRRVARNTRRSYLLSVLHEAEDLGLVLSRNEVRPTRNRAGPQAHLVWEVTELGIRELFDSRGTDE